MKSGFLYLDLNLYDRQSYISDRFVLAWQFKTIGLSNTLPPPHSTQQDWRFNTRLNFSRLKVLVFEISDFSVSFFITAFLQTDP